MNKEINQIYSKQDDSPNQGVKWYGWLIALSFSGAFWYALYLVVTK